MSDLKVELKSKNENKIEDTQALQEKKFKDFFEQQWFLAYFDKISKKIKENKIKKFKKVHIELTNIWI